MTLNTAREGHRTLPFPQEEPPMKTCQCRTCTRSPIPGCECCGEEHPDKLLMQDLGNGTYGEFLCVRCEQEIVSDQSTNPPTVLLRDLGPLDMLPRRTFVPRAPTC